MATQLDDSFALNTKITGQRSRKQRFTHAESHPGETISARIRRHVLSRIERGVYPPGQALPSEHELAQEFGATRLTVRNALDELVQNGLVRRVQGKGTFVIGPWGLRDDLTEASGFRQMAEAQFGTPSVRILAQSTRLAGPYFADLLHVSEDDVLYHVRRLNSINKMPISIEDTYIPLSLFPDIDKLDLSIFSLYATYERYGHKVEGVQEKLDLTVLSARAAGLLQTKAGEPALVLECISFDAAGQPVEYVNALHRGDHGGYSFVY